MENKNKNFIKIKTGNSKLNSKLNTKILNFIFLAGVCFILLLSISAAEDWQMFRHDLEHSGRTSDVIENPGNLELKWKFETGSAIYSSPAVFGDYLYIGSYDGFVYCINKNTGELKWKFKTGMVVSSSPAIAGNYIFVCSEDSFIYCLNKQTGELKWKFETGMAISSSPAVFEDYLYVSSHDGLVYCLNKDRGEVIRKFETMGTSSSTAISGNHIYIQVVPIFFPRM